MNAIRPTMSLWVTSGSITKDIDIGTMPDSISQDWNGIYGQFDVTVDIAGADLVSIYFTKVNKAINIVVDDLLIS